MTKEKYIPERNFYWGRISDMAVYERMRWTRRLDKFRAGECDYPLHVIERKILRAIRLETYCAKRMMLNAMNY